MFNKASGKTAPALAVRVPVKSSSPDLRRSPVRPTRAPSWESEPSTFGKAQRASEVRYACNCLINHTLIHIHARLKTQSGCPYDCLIFIWAYGLASACLEVEDYPEMSNARLSVADASLIEDSPPGPWRPAITKQAVHTFSYLLN